MGLDHSRVQALCFDVDGTLSDTDDLFARRIEKFLPRFLFRDPARAARRIVMRVESPANSLLGLTDTLGIDDELIGLVEWANKLHKPRPKKFWLIPGVDKMLARLQGHYPMAVVSARDEKGTLAFLDQFDLAKYFDAIVTALSTEHTKPYPDPILLAAQKMNTAPEACLMIGDTTVDIRAGKSAGAQTAGVLCGFGEEPELKHFGADLILPSTAQLADVLLAANQG